MITIEGLNDKELYNLAKNQIDEEMKNRAKLESDKKPFLDRINELNYSNNNLKQIIEELDNVISFVSVLNNKIKLIEITRESPDCIIKLKNRFIGIEVQDFVLSEKAKEIESIFDSLVREVQIDLLKNDFLKGFYTIKFSSPITNLKMKVKNQIKSEIKKIILGEIEINESIYIDNINRSEHSCLYLRRDNNAYITSSISPLYLKGYIQDKEDKVENYIRNSSLTEIWLLIVKNSKYSSDFAFIEDSDDDLFAKSKFERIYIFDAFRKEIILLK